MTIVAWAITNIDDYTVIEIVYRLFATCYKKETAKVQAKTNYAKKVKICYGIKHYGIL